MLTGRCGTYGCTGGERGRPAGRLYSAHAQFSFTYPPFAAALFRLGTTGTEGWLAAGITVLSIGALVVLVWLSLTAAGIRPRPDAVFAVAALSALLWPVAYTLHLGEINLVVAAAVAADLLRRRDGGWWQGIGTGLAAGIKLTPLIFVVYLLITRRLQAAVTAAVAFAATIAAGWLLLPAASRMFWLDGVFAAQSRVGNAANPSNQSLAGAAARLAGGHLTGGHLTGATRLAAGRRGGVRARRAGRAGQGPPARLAAGRGVLLRDHRAARVSVLVGASLGMGCATADLDGHHRLAAPLGRGRGGHRGSGGRLFRADPADLARTPGEPGPDAGQ